MELNSDNLMDAIFDNPLQNSLDEMQRKISKPVHTAPKIKGIYNDVDDGKNYYILENGNTIESDKYDSFWHPKHTKPVMPQSHKGDNPDKTRII